MNNWPLLVEAILESTSWAVVIYFWIWLEMGLQKNIQQELAVSD